MARRKEIKNDTRSDKDEAGEAEKIQVMFQMRGKTNRPYLSDTKFVTSLKPTETRGLVQSLFQSQSRFKDWQRRSDTTKRSVKKRRGSSERRKERTGKCSD